MESLHTKILAAARDEVARSHGFKKWDSDELNSPWLDGDRLLGKEDLDEEVCIIALSIQYDFLRWLPKNGYRQTGNKDVWWNRNTLVKATELELYDIWRRDAETH